MKTKAKAIEQTVELPKGAKGFLSDLDKIRGLMGQEMSSAQAVTHRQAIMVAYLVRKVNPAHMGLRPARPEMDMYNSWQRINEADLKALFRLYPDWGAADAKISQLLRTEGILPPKLKNEYGAAWEALKPKLYPA